MKYAMILVSLLLVLAFAGNALALGPLDASAKLGLFTKYVWRGMVITDDPVLQPELSASVMDFGADIWGNMDLTDYHKSADDPSGLKGQLNEVDYTLHYGISLPLLSLEGGLIHYTFPNTGVNSTSEVYVSAEASVLFSPSLALYYDFDEIDGGYIQLGVSHELALTPSTNLNLLAYLGYGSADYVTGYFGDLSSAKAVTTLGTGPTDFQLTAALPKHPLPLIEITPSVTYSTLLGDAKDVTEVADGAKDAFFFGITAGLDF